MKNNILKTISTITFLMLLVITACQNKNVKTIEIDEDVVEEVKKTPPLRVETPAPSPFSSIEQKVGLTDVTVEYSRPGMKGRAIYGNLVPYDKIWRTGANARTKVTFSSDVTIDGKNLAKGTYAIFTKPNKKAWDVYFYTEHKGNGAPQKWDESKVAVHVKVDVLSMPMKIETFTITIDDITNTTALIGLLWEDVYIGIPFTVPTESAVMASIEKVMASEAPSANSFYNAAVYFLNNNKDINKALAWVDKSIEMTKDDPKFWMLRQQSLIHAKAGKKETAIAAAKKSLELAKKAGNDDYVKMNTDSLKEWGAM